MKLTNNDINELVELVKEWAYEKNLHTLDPSKQVLKLGEEFGELCEGMSKGDFAMVMDGIGDNLVVLIVLCTQFGIGIEDCLEMAYNEIKDRKGKVINGVFVKEGDYIE